MKFLKVIGLALLILVIVVFAGAAFVKYNLPNVQEAPELTVKITPERVEHGRYLANSVMGCMDCHAVRDESRFAMPVVEGTEGAGGGAWTPEKGFPGNMVAPNITPHHLGDWSDGEIYRAITAGVDNEGNALFPIMPYQNYGRLDDEDIHAVIAYLRTLDPIAKDHPERELDFPLSLIVNTMPKDPEEKMEKPDPANKLAYGEYMITAASCGDCHTPQKNGKYIQEMFLAGGMEFRMANGTVCRSSNLTPDVETGIGDWDLASFMNRFNSYRDSDYKARVVSEGEFHTEMPWEYYATMRDEDLESIFAYLQSLEPIRHEVVKHEKVTLADVE